MILKLKLQYFGHLMRRVDSLEKTLMLRGIGGRRKRGWQQMTWLDSIIDSMDVSFSELREMVMDREAWRAAIHGIAKSRTWLSNWTELTWKYIILRKNQRQKRKIWHFYQNTFLVISAYKKNKAIIISETVMKRARKIVKPAVILGNTNSMISWGLCLKVKH